jgi:FMN reductase
MTQHRIVGIVGSVQRPSKSRRLVEAVGAEVVRATGADFAVHDLIDIGPGLGSAFSRKQATPEVEQVLREIETADALIVGTPVYKGSYTGLFKHLFDLVDAAALKNVPVVLTATGGGFRHALIVEHQLRPLFGFFEALTAPTAIYASDPDFTDGNLTGSAVTERVAAAAGQLTALLNQRAVSPPATPTVRLVLSH